MPATRYTGLRTPACHPGEARQLKERNMVFDAFKYRNQMRSWQKKHDAVAPKAGAMAPDFELRDARGESPVRLSAFRGNKPVALVLGSYT
ncbi:MAG: hypothetical protein HYX84_04115 [Chloroflexi bacterium]|nr:hypothetical protein [Chloroflexota bacterium]